MVSGSKEDAIWFGEKPTSYLELFVMLYSRLLNTGHSAGVLQGGRGSQLCMDSEPDKMNGMAWFWGCLCQKRRCVSRKPERSE